MKVQRLLTVVEKMDGTKVVVRFRGLSPDEDTEEPLSAIHEDVPDLLLKVLARKAKPSSLENKARRKIGLPNGGV